jgi:hypothetical protein
MGGQHRRCLGLLRAGAAPLTEADVRFRYLAARCLAALGDWEEVLALLSSPGGGPDFEDLAPAVRTLLCFCCTRESKYSTSVSHMQ